QADPPEADDPDRPEVAAPGERPDPDQDGVDHDVGEQVLAELPLPPDAGERCRPQLLLVRRGDLDVVAAHQRPFQTGLPFSAKEAMPSRKSSEEKHDSRSSISSRSCSGVRRPSEVSRSMACLLPRIERGALAATSAARSTATSSSSASPTTSLTNPISSALCAG